MLVLLPLIEVAWADGVIQPAERDLILSVARYQFDFSDDALDMLDAWLSHRPREDYLVRGRDVLKALADARGEIWRRIDLERGILFHHFMEGRGRLKA